MTEAKLSPAARIVLNPWDAQRNQTQEQVINAALVYVESGLFADFRCLRIACLALLEYTAPKHKPTRKAAK